MSRAKLGTGRALSKPIQWLLRDEFSDTRAAGSVNGTMPTPGPGGARALDTDTTMSMSGDALHTDGFVSAGSPRLYYGGIARAAGRMLFARITTPGSSGSSLGVGWSANSDGSAGTTLFFFQTGGVVANMEAGGVSGKTFANFSNSTSYTVANILRSTGACFLWLSGGLWLLMYVNSASSSATMYPILSKYNGSADYPVNYARIPADLWLPTPLVSDGFGSSFGTSDGLGHAETSGIGSGGGGITWTSAVGTWTVSSSKAAAATLSGGVAAATVPTPTADVFAKVKVTRSAGSGGMVLRWTDANNHLYTEHDGTNAYLKQVLSGSTTTLITAAATYSAGAEIMADLSGVNCRLYYNGVIIGSTGGINSGLTATAHGLRSTDTGGIQLDDFVVYAKGTGGEYNLLNRYVNL